MNNTKNIIIGLFLILIFLPVISAAQTVDPADCDCSSEIIRITELTQNNSNLSQKIIHYSNLSEYYEEAYLEWLVVKKLKRCLLGEKILIATIKQNGK